MTRLQRFISLAALASTAFFATQAAQASLTNNGDPRYQNGSNTPTPALREGQKEASGGGACAGCSAGPG
jgi:hypothetical protein